jgi:phosphate:Na+ symporter
MIAAVTDILDMAKEAFANNDIETAFAIESLEEVIDDIKDILRKRHIERLQQSNCSIEAGFVWADLLTNLERVADHCSNIAGGIIDYSHGDRSTHESLRTIKTSDDVFAEKFAYYKEKYMLPVGNISTEE